MPANENDKAVGYSEALAIPYHAKVSLPGHSFLIASGFRFFKNTCLFLDLILPNYFLSLDFRIHSALM
jgi:hypothetical protein